MLVQRGRRGADLSAHAASLLALVPAEGQIRRLAQTLGLPLLLRHPPARGLLLGRRVRVRRLGFRDLIADDVLKKKTAA